MATCQSCGGIIGRDCFNTIDCAMISAREDNYKDYEVSVLRETVSRLIEILDAHGINVDELKPKTEPAIVYISDPLGDLPF